MRGLGKLRPPAWMVAAGVVGLVLGPLLFGVEPIGDDPDLLYRPIKSELSRALQNGEMPFWSDKFGLGVPLIAESHVAAYYPPNLLFYRYLDPSTAYRLLIWLHYIATALTTFAYARTLGIGRSGAMLASLAFTLCGFQAIHACHEPFYTLMPFLPLCLLMSERYLASGRLAWLAGLALTWGAQLTIGHFQIQMWTGGLVLLIGGWRVVFDGSPRLRWLGLFSALIWGAAVAAVQLVPTWGLTRISGFSRTAEFLAIYAFPPSHWAQFAIPALFLGRAGPLSTYWGNQQTTPGEAAAYLGTIPLVLAWVGLVSDRKPSRLTPWVLIALAGFVLASLPRWWPSGFEALIRIPGLGWFRAPGRYTLLTCLGLSLLAGRGLDRAVSSRRFGLGLALAIGFGVAAWSWSVYYLSSLAEFRASVGGSATLAFGVAAAAWIAGLAAILAWRRGWLGGGWPILLTAAELAWLFYRGPVVWERPIRVPETSPILRRLVEEPTRGLVAGGLQNLPVQVGRTAAYPLMGITAPPPNYLLEPSTRPEGRDHPIDQFWQRLFGVSHAVWKSGDRPPNHDGEILLESPDPALSRLFHEDRDQLWTLVRYRDSRPRVWAARQVHEVPDWGALYQGLPRADLDDQAWIIADDLPREGIGLDGPAASRAVATNWDGREAIVEHDGACVLVIRRTHYPGWRYQIDSKPSSPVLRVDGGLQGVPIPGSGSNRVRLFYRPIKQRYAEGTSTVAIAIALIVVAWPALRSSGLPPVGSRLQVRSG